MTVISDDQLIGLFRRHAAVNFDQRNEDILSMYPALTEEDVLKLSPAFSTVASDPQTPSTVLLGMVAWYSATQQIKQWLTNNARMTEPCWDNIPELLLRELRAVYARNVANISAVFARGGITYGVQFLCGAKLSSTLAAYDWVLRVGGAHVVQYANDLNHIYHTHLLRNPNLPLPQLLAGIHHYPSAVLQNPYVNLLLLEDPRVFQDILREGTHTACDIHRKLKQRAHWVLLAGEPSLSLWINDVWFQGAQTPTKFMRYERWEEFGVDVVNVWYEGDARIHHHRHTGKDWFQWIKQYGFIHSFNMSGAEAEKCFIKSNQGLEQVTKRWEGPEE